MRPSKTKSPPGKARTNPRLILLPLWLAPVMMLVWLMGRSQPAGEPQPAVAGATPAPLQAEDSFVAMPSLPSPLAPTPPPPTALVSSPEDSLTHSEPPEAAAEMDAILEADRTASHKALALLDRYPLWPEAARLEAVQHMVNLIADEDFPLLTPLLFNPQSPAQVLEAIMDDLLLRPEVLRLPILLELSRNQAHPLSVEAASLAAFYQDADSGQDWPRGAMAPDKSSGPVSSCPRESP